MQFCVEGYYMCNFVSNWSPNSVALQVAKKLPHVTALLLVHQQLLLNSCYGKGVLRRVGSNTEVFLHLGNDFGGKADLSRTNSPFPICSTVVLNMDVRQFRAILHFLPEIASHPPANIL